MLVIDEYSIPRYRYKKRQYAAGSWNRRRRLIIKGAVKHIYEHIYCARGDIENRIKTLKHGLKIDRTNCHNFLANQLRVLVTATAYILFQELRLHARHTEGLHEMARGRLAIVIAPAFDHQDADRIVFPDEGRVLDLGDHDEPVLSSKNI